MASSWVHRRVLGNERICLVSDVSLQLSLELIDFIAQVCDNILVSRYVLADHLFVWFNSHLDIFSPVGIL